VVYLDTIPSLVTAGFFRSAGEQKERARERAREGVIERVKGLWLVGECQGGKGGGRQEGIEAGKERVRPLTRRPHPLRPLQAQSLRFLSLQPAHLRAVNLEREKERTGEGARWGGGREGGRKGRSI
jgi:hypothetical protein